MEKALLVGGAFALGLIIFVLARLRRARLALRASSLTVVVRLEDFLPDGVPYLIDLLARPQAGELFGEPFIELLEVRHRCVPWCYRGSTKSSGSAHHCGSGEVKLSRLYTEGNKKLVNILLNAVF